MALSLGQRAMNGQLTHFLPEDFYYIVDKTSQAPDRLVLVGGQAIEVWGVVLGVAPPTSIQANGQQFHALTIDTDWLGQKEDASWLAQLLGVEHTELQIPAFGDPTPNTAILYLERNGRVMLMDFLSHITGLETSKLLKYAADVDVPMPNGKTVPLRVLDPVHCLVSRMVNLKTYDSKRRGNGFLQAQWALNILSAYLDHMVKRGASEDVMRAQCHRVSELAEYGSTAAEFCFVQYQIDPLQTVCATTVAAGGADFASIDWPNTVARIRRKQEKWIQKQRRL